MPLIAPAAIAAKAAFDDVVAADIAVTATDVGLQAARLAVTNLGNAPIGTPAAVAVAQAALRTAHEEKVRKQVALTTAEVREGFAVMGLLHTARTDKPRFTNGFMCIKLDPDDMTATPVDWRFVADNDPEGHRTLVPIANADYSSGPHPPPQDNQRYVFDVLEELPWKLCCMLFAASAEPKPLPGGGHDDETLAVAVAVDSGLEFLGCVLAVAHPAQ